MIVEFSPEQIAKLVREKIEAAIEEAAYEASKVLIEKIRSKTAVVVASLMSNYQFTKQGNIVTIEVKLPEGK